MAIAPRLRKLFATWMGFRLGFLAPVLALAMVCPAFAGLMGSTYDLRLTGPVVAGGQFGIERYEGTDIPFDGAGVGLNGDNLVNTISPTPVPPFTSAVGHAPRVFEPSEGAILGQNVLNVDIWIRGEFGDPFDRVFVNPLNTSDPTKFVELELWLTFDDLPAGQMVQIDAAHLIKGVQFAAESIETSGIGTAADPLYVLIKYDPSDVNMLGFGVKTWFDYHFEDIPEPTTLAMMVIGLVGMAAAKRRRRC